MAKSIQNVVMQGASGKIGKTLVFRQLGNGLTVIANRAKPQTKPRSLKQDAVIERFQQAAYMAKIFANDPVVGPLYLAKAKPGQSAYIVAMKDCLTAPAIKRIAVHGYNGSIGNGIGIRAVDDFQVTSVSVRIFSGDNGLIEQGEASEEDNNLDWTYVTTATNSTLSGTRIEVTARDYPGNETVETITIN